MDSIPLQRILGYKEQISTCCNRFPHVANQKVQKYKTSLYPSVVFNL